MGKDWLRVASQQQPIASDMNEENVVLQPLTGFVVVIAKASEFI